MKPQQLRLLVLGLACLAGLPACVTARPGAAGRHLEGAPDPAEVIRDLAAQSDSVRTLRAGGTVTVTSPRSEAVERFRNATVAYRSPSDLYVVGRKGLNVLGFRLVCGHEGLLFEVPADDVREVYPAGKGRMSGGLSAEDLSGELFLADLWGRTGARDVRVVAYERAPERVTLDVRSPGGSRHTVEAVRFGQGPWVLSRTELSRRGRPVMEVRREAYQAVEGVPVPEQVGLWFPTERLRLDFELKSIRVNAEVKEDWFVIGPDIEGSRPQSRPSHGRPYPGDTSGSRGSGDRDRRLQPR